MRPSELSAPLGPALDQHQSPASPPRNFTGIKRSGGAGCSSRSTASTFGMPLPFACGANFRTRCAAKPVTPAEIASRITKPTSPWRCDQSMVEPRRRSDHSRAIRKRAPTSPMSHPTRTPKARERAGCHPLASGRDRAAQGLEPWPPVFFHSHSSQKTVSQSKRRFSDRIYLTRKPFYCASSHN